MITERDCCLGFGNGLFGAACQPGNHDQWSLLTETLQVVMSSVRGKFENWRVQAAFPYRKLGGMNPHRQSTRTRFHVVPRERALPAVIELSVGIECEGVRRDNRAFLKQVSDSGGKLRSMHGAESFRNGRWRS